METNGYNPDFVAGSSRGLLRTVIANETMHCAALHHTRRGERDLRRWNIACDHAKQRVRPSAALSCLMGQHGADPGAVRGVVIPHR
jgi:predicted metal-dependent peptidase